MIKHVLDSSWTVRSSITSPSKANATLERSGTITSRTGFLPKKRTDWSCQILVFFKVFFGQLDRSTGRARRAGCSSQRPTWAAGRSRSMDMLKTHWFAGRRQWVHRKSLNGRRRLRVCCAVPVTDRPSVRFYSCLPPPQLRRPGDCRREAVSVNE